MKRIERENDSKKIEEMTKKELIEEVNSAWRCANAINNYCWEQHDKINKWRKICWFSVFVNVVQCVLILMFR